VIGGTVVTETVSGVMESEVPRLRALLAQNTVPFLIRMQSHVRKNKLSGQVLKRRTGQLSAGIGYRVAQEGQEVVGEIYAGAETKDYAGVHEFGGTFTIPEHERLIRKVWGRRLKTPKTVKVRTHQATFDENSFLRSTLEDFRRAYREDVVARSVRQLTGSPS